MSGKKNINDLREELFGALQDLRAGRIDVAKAKAVANLGQAIVNSAKVENEFIKATGSKGSGFVPEALPVPPAVPGAPGLTVRRHTLQG